MNWGNEKQVIDIFGSAGGLACTKGLIKLPFEMKLSWDLKTNIRSIRCHEKVAESAQRVFNKIAKTYTLEEIEEHGFNVFGGCYSFREKRGGGGMSLHSWGVAFDIDPMRNQYTWKKDKAYLAKDVCKAFLDIWEEEGWHSLGRVKNRDWMHIQAPDF